MNNDKNDRSEAIKKAINYLLKKNPYFKMIGNEILYDSAEKKYYDCETGMLLNKKFQGGKL